MRRVIDCAVVLFSLIGTDVIAVSFHEDDPLASTPHRTYFRPRSLSGGYSSFASGGGFPASGIELLDWRVLGDFGPQHQNGNSLWGYTSPSGREYALMGLSDGLGVVEISNPRDTRIIAVIAGPESLWRDVRVYQNYCYAVSEGGGGIQVIDLSQVDDGIVTLVGSVTSGGGLSTHTVAIDEASGYLYRAGGDNNGIRVYDLADPVNPAYVGAWLTRYTHEATPVTYTSGPYAGRQIVYSCGGLDGGWTATGLDVLDVTDKSNILYLKHVSWSLAGYSHQGWPSPDLKYFYIDDELDEYFYGVPTGTIVYDISDPGNPAYVGTFTNGNTSIGHNVYTKGKYLYEANYRSGLRIFDATNPTSPTEVAYFDTWPDDDGVAFNSLWNVYVYFESGTIIGSDIEKGLFVWRFGEGPLKFRFPEGLPKRIDPDGDVVKVRIKDPQGILAAGSARLHVDMGAGYQEISLIPAGGDRYLAKFLPAPCPSRVEYYFSADTIYGETIQEPACAPDEVFRTTASRSQILLSVDDMEQDSGWQVGSPSDTATAGIWERADPQATAAQPEDDHSSSGTLCWVTKALAGVDQDQYDVDGGKTTLTSPLIDLGGHAVVKASYWMWYSNTTGNDPGADFLDVEISADQGQTWSLVETVGPTGTPGWTYREFFVQDQVGAAQNVMVRFIVADENFDSTVEAAVDDFALTAFECSPGTGSFAGLSLR